jgi:hypothetical protein
MLELRKTLKPLGQKAAWMLTFEPLMTEVTRFLIHQAEPSRRRGLTGTPQAIPAVPAVPDY